VIVVVIVVVVIKIKMIKNVEISVSMAKRGRKNWQFKSLVYQRRRLWVLWVFFDACAWCFRCSFDDTEE